MAKDANTKIIKAATFGEAVAKAKSQYGSDFDIVTRRRIEQKGLFSKLSPFKLGGESCSVELEISLSPQEKPEKKPGKKPGKAVEKTEKHQLVRSYEKAIELERKFSENEKRLMTDKAQRHVTISESTAGVGRKMDDIQDGMATLRQQTQDGFERILDLLALNANGGLPGGSPELIECYRGLIKANVSEPLAREIVDEINKDSPGSGDREAIEQNLLASVARRLPCAGPILFGEKKPVVVMLVGPSGTGKTTMLAKLAIQYGMRQRKSVGLINEDLYRPGAEGQITTVGRMLNTAVPTATDPAEIADIVRSMSNRDIVFIDTGGRSPRNEGGIRRLADIARAVGVDETHLVIETRGDGDFLQDTLTAYRASGFNRIILTKLDECSRHGGIVDVGSELDVGFSYVSTGIAYTGTFDQADATWLAEAVLGKRTIAPSTHGGGDAENSAS